jgi:RNA polymerase sigma factor (sigma-70 family)
VEDGLLIARRTARSGAALDTRAAEALLAELRPLVVRTVRLVVGSGSVVAEDAAQESLLEITRALPSLDDIGAAPAWAARIAARMALRTARRERRLALTGLRAVDVPEAIPAECPPDVLELKEAFDELPPKLRATAVLRLYVGLSEAETATALECSIGTVKSQLHEARRRLTRQLGGARSPTVTVIAPTMKTDCPEGG